MGTPDTAAHSYDHARTCTRIEEPRAVAFTAAPHFIIRKNRDPYEIRTRSPYKPPYIPRTSPVRPYEIPSTSVRDPPYVPRTSPVHPFGGLYGSPPSTGICKAPHSACGDSLRAHTKFQRSIRPSWRVVVLFLSFWPLRPWSVLRPAWSRSQRS